MHGTADDVADHDPDQRNGAVKGAENGSENGTDTGDIQELDQKGPAGTQRYVVHPIVETLLGRDIGGIYPRLLFHKGTVEAVTEQQDGKAEEEQEHLVTSILIWRRPCAELRWPEVQITPQLSAGG